MEEKNYVRTVKHTGFLAKTKEEGKELARKWAEERGADVTGMSASPYNSEDYPFYIHLYYTWSREAKQKWKEKYPDDIV